jgi:peptide deformylase
MDMSSDWPIRLRIEQAGTPVLQQRARDVPPGELRTTDIQRLIDMMFATLEGAGVGLAAPQVGVGLRLVVIEDPEAAQSALDPRLLAAQERVPVARHVLVNPVLTVQDATPMEFFEGCLSVEGYRAIVPRARAVHVEALDRHGERFERIATGWYARILQHEVDHLDGRLYLERMHARSFVTAASYSERWSRLDIAEAGGLLGL